MQAALDTDDTQPIQTEPKAQLFDLMMPIQGTEEESQDQNDYMKEDPEIPAVEACGLF